MTQTNDLNNLRTELSIKAKNGIDFTFAAAITWLLISYIWSLEKTSFNKSILTFYAGGIMFPLAIAFSKLFKTNWKVKENPLQPLGLWLNFAQLFYFPILIYSLYSSPENFVFVYAIITGAHFFPYAWFYNTKWYAIIAAISVIFSLVQKFNLRAEMIYLLPLSFSLQLFILTFLLHLDWKSKV